MKKTNYFFRKKIRSHLLLLVLTFLSLQFQAQTQKTPKKGNWMLGQSFSINTTKTRDTNFAPETHSFTIMMQANVAYFVSQRFSIGLLINYLYKKEIFEFYGSPYIWKNIELGPMLRYYPFAGLFFEAASKWNTDYYHVFTSENGSNFQHHFGIGYSYLINPSVAIEPLLKYQFYTPNDLYNTSRKTTFLLGIQITL